MAKVVHKTIDNFLPEREAPAGQRGAVLWIRQRMFSSWSDGLVSIVVGAISIWALWSLISWSLINATWVGDVNTCRANASAACWPYVVDRFNGFLYGFYPLDQQWRVDIVMVSLFVGVGLLAWPKCPKRYALGVFMILIYPFLAAFLLIGWNEIGLVSVPSRFWGGFLATLVVAVVANVVSLPLGILLALGRQSNLPFIKAVSIVFIEFWRGVPLITVLFVAAYILPLFFPGGLDLDQLVRVLICVAIFEAAYLAEVIRGGLQSIGKGQHEAGASLGLSYWRNMRLIILPQALKVSIPGIVNSFVALFKDTTLLLIVNILDLLGMIHAGTRDATWASPNVAYTGYVFAAFVFWVFCYGMSLYARKLENRLHAGHEKTK